MSIMSLLMSLAVAWIIQSMQVDSKLRQRQAAHQALMRIDQLLRTDVYNAESMHTRGPDTLVVNAGDGRTVIYRIIKNSLAYEIRRGQTPLRAELFRLNEDAVAHWNSAHMPRAIQLVVARGGDNVSDGTVDLNVCARLPDDRIFRLHNKPLVETGD